MSDKQCDIAMVGLGVMGRNFVLNMADCGFSVVGYDLDAEKVEALRQEGAGKPVTVERSCSRLDGFVGLPRCLPEPLATRQLDPSPA